MNKILSYQSLLYHFSAYDIYTDVVLAHQYFVGSRFSAGGVNLTLTRSVDLLYYTEDFSSFSCYKDEGIVVLAEQS